MPRRLLPNAAFCANGVLAPLLTLPLIRNPSEGACCASCGGAGEESACGRAPSPAALTWARWKPPAVFCTCGCGLPLAFFAGALPLVAGAFLLAATIEGLPGSAAAAVGVDAPGAGAAAGVE